MNRSVNVDLEELEAGKYTVLMKISARRWTSKLTVEEVVRSNCRDRPDKLIQVGLSYDLAHAKGQFKETEAEKKEREAREEKKKATEKKKLRAELREMKFKAWQLNVKQRARDKRHAKKKEERHRKRALLEPGKETIGIEDPPPGDVAADENPIPAEEPNSEPTKLEQDVSTLPSPGPEAEPADPTEPAAAKHPAAEEPTAAADDLVNGDAPNNDPAPPSIAVAPSITGGPPPLESDYDSDASFDSSIDSDLDFPPPGSADSAAAIIAAPPAAAADDDDDDEDADFENDPWNAVCVVGLRVYSKDEGTCVDVVRPGVDEEEDEGEGEEEDAALDVDDVSKGASGEAVVVGAEEGKDGQGGGKEEVNLIDA